jgi:hypothetical protein
MGNLLVRVRPVQKDMHTWGIEYLTNEIQSNASRSDDKNATYSLGNSDPIATMGRCRSEVPTLPVGSARRHDRSGSGSSLRSHRHLFSFLRQPEVGDEVKFEAIGDLGGRIMESCQPPAYANRADGSFSARTLIFARQGILKENKTSFRLPLTVVL